VLSRDQVSALVTLYSYVGDVNSAVNVLDEAVEHAQKNKVSLTVLLIDLPLTSTHVPSYPAKQ